MNASSQDLQDLQGRHENEQIKNLKEIHPKGYIFEIQRLSTEDGPGIRTTVFLKGCPLKCAWCHNPESIEKQLSIQWFEKKCIGCNICVEVCPQHAISFDSSGLHINRDQCHHCGKCVSECPTKALQGSGEYWMMDRLMEEILKDQSYYDQSNGGITVSGGEPTQQIDFLEDFLIQCKKKGLHIALDTCGLANRSKYERILPYIDLILYDLKEIDPELHKKFTGASNSLILENAIWLAEELHRTGKQLWIRTPIIPGYTATEENIRGIGDFIIEKLHGNVERWDLLAYNNLAAAKYQRLDLEYPIKDASLFSRVEMEEFYNIASEAGNINVQWSGLTKKS
ncbi:MAG: glycyl-radical enzyme activating protein [Promethearchaeota archaeon]